MVDRNFSILTEENINISITDVGARDLGSLPPYIDMVKSGQANLYGFDIDESSLENLKVNSSSNEVYLPYVIADGKVRELHICHSSGMTSLLKPNLELLKMFNGLAGASNVEKKILVQTVSLDDVSQISTIDFLKMDIQGAELLVLKSAPVRIKEILALQLEVNFLQMYEDQPLFSEVEIFLRHHGFMLHKLIDIQSRSIRPIVYDSHILSNRGQIFWADAVFIKDFRSISSISPNNLLKLSAILHNFYQSYDMAHNILLEHDVKTGRNLASHYLTQLTSGT